MKKGESIQETHIRFTFITNELRCLREPISTSKQVKKILKLLPKSWKIEVDAMTKAKYLKTLTMND